MKRILDDHGGFVLFLVFFGLVVWAVHEVNNYKPIKRNPETFQRAFKECLTNVPKGAESIHNSNDWDEVVRECRDQAREFSDYELHYK